MRLLAITVSETGVVRIDVFATDQEEYPRAVKFHQEIAPLITELDKAIKEKCNGLLGATH
jgi:hypothetical protein